MSRRRTLSDTGVANLMPRATRFAVPDPELRGHYVRVAPTGGKTYVTVARDPDGKQTWITIGTSELMSIEEARDKAREAIKRVRAGLPAVEPPPTKPESFKAVSENYFKRHVLAQGLRSQNEIQRILTKYVLPVWQDREFVEIKRSHVASLLDAIQDRHGARQADYALAIVRGIANWFASRHDDYVSPFTRGMRRTDPKSRKRARTLDDDEIPVIWKQAERDGPFGAIIRLALLTAQRREKIAAMKWGDLSVGGEWRIPSEDREKGTGGLLVLPDMAVAIVQAQYRFTRNPHVFAGRGDGHFNGFSPCKRAFDAKVPIQPWVVHDLRRTARSLMSRAGIRPDIAERVLGHAIVGVEGVYDRHSYRDEKADALKRLAGLIETIINPPAGNVVSIREVVQ